MLIKKILLLWLIASLNLSLSTLRRIEAEEFHVIIYNGLVYQGGAQDFPEISLKEEFGIIEHKYHPADEKAIKAAIGPRRDIISIMSWKEKYNDVYKPLDSSFVDNLVKSKLLYIGQYCGDHCIFLFKPEYAEAFKEFLRKGGLILFDYNASTPREAVTSFLASVDVVNPDPMSFKTGSYKAVVSPKDKEHLLVNKPNMISGELSAYGWWEKWSDKQIALFRNSSCPEKGAAMIIQENVLGQGRIIFNQISPVFRKGEEGKRLLENILIYAYGSSLKGEGVVP